MKQHGQHTHHEILSQPDAWAEAIAVGEAASAQLQDLWRRLSPEEILFTGCGSTYYLSICAAALARERGLVARAAPASEIWLSTTANVARAAKTLLVTVSRSGETTETLRAVEAFRRAGGRAVVAATCYPQSTLARAADLTLAAPLAQEQSMAQTRSFASMVLLCQGIINALRPADGFRARMASLPGLGRTLITQHADLAATLGRDLSLQRFFFLGNGPRYGLACEAMLKMKEMSISYSEAYHTLEFRHGPKSMVDATTLVIGLLSDETWAYEAPVLNEMRGLGARTLTLVDGLTRSGGADAGDTTVYLSKGKAVSEHVVLYLPILQLLAYERAMAKQVDPDAPQNLSAVVVL